MSLTYVPASEPLHISVEFGFRDPGSRIRVAKSGCRDPVFVPAVGNGVRDGLRGGWKVPGEVWVLLEDAQVQGREPRRATVF